MVVELANTSRSNIGIRSNASDGSIPFPSTNLKSWKFIFSFLYFGYHVLYLHSLFSKSWSFLHRSLWRCCYKVTSTQQQRCTFNQTLCTMAISLLWRISFKGRSFKPGRWNQKKEKQKIYWVFSKWWWNWQTRPDLISGFAVMRVTVQFRSRVLI